MDSSMTFEYQLLGRLQRDCEYYLGFGNRDKKRLWALDEALQIQKMKEIYESLPVKPEWISLEEINAYEEKMSESENPDYWYLNRHQLESGQVFRLSDDTLVKLDCRVAGDGTKWRVADWSNGWAYCDSEIEPGDLRGKPIDETQLQAMHAVERTEGLSDRS